MFHNRNKPENIFDWLFQKRQSKRKWNFLLRSKPKSEKWSCIYTICQRTNHHPWTQFGWYCWHSTRLTVPLHSVWHFTRTWILIEFDHSFWFHHTKSYLCAKGHSLWFQKLFEQCCLHSYIPNADEKPDFVIIDDNRTVTAPDITSFDGHLTKHARVLIYAKISIQW